MDSSQMTGYGKPENTAYDRARHAEMKLRPIGYGYFAVNRSFYAVICEGCKQEIEGKPTRTHNKKPYHVECYKLL